MPKRNNLATSASKKNDKAIATASASAVFARVESSLGFSRFRVAVHDGKGMVDIQASLRGLFRQRKAGMPISKNDIVMLEGYSPSSTHTCEIVARVDKPSAQKLYEAGRIHKVIFVPSDDTTDELFDYGSDTSAVDIDAI